ncbi:MAG: hypothetical protein ABGW87_07160 [Sphingomonadaceae bacterium]
MLEQLLIEDLANCPPQVWALRIRQASIISPLLRNNARSTEIADACEKLGVSRRRIRQLITLARTRQSGVGPRGHNTGLGLWLGAAKESLIEEAIFLSRRDATLKEFGDIVAKLSRRLKVEEPSSVTIRHRFNSRRAEMNSIERLQLRNYVTFDLTPLRLSVFDDEGNSQTAWLLVGFSRAAAQVIGHDMFPGRPNSSTLGRALGAILHDQSRASRFGATSGILKILATGSGHLGNKMCAASTTQTWKTGTIIRAVYGLKIGRIHLLSDNRARRENGMTPVPLQAARKVLEFLLVAAPEFVNLAHRS